MTWTDTSATVVTLNASTTDTLFNATGFSGITNLDSDHRVLLCNREIVISSGANTRWEERNAIIIIHFSGEMLNMNDSNGVMQLGEADLTDQDRPIVTHGCWFLYDQEANSGSASQYGFLGDSTTAENGNINMYGGVVETWPCNNTTASGGCFWCFKDDVVNTIGVNFTRYGGGRFFGNDFRIQECKFMGSGRLGFSVLGTNDPVGIRDVILQDMVQGYYLSGFQSADTEYTNVGLRNAPANLGASDQSDFSADAFNCDPITSFFGTSDFSNVTTDFFNEYTTYDLSVVAGGDQPLASGTPDEGDPLDDCEVRIIRTESTGEDDDTFSSDLVEVSQQNTNASGQITQVNLIRRRFDDGDSTESSGKDYRGYNVHLRMYGFDYETIPKFPQAGQGRALADTVILKVNSFVVGTEAAVSAYTGIGLDTVNDEIDVTSAHTLQEIYDYLQWYMSQTAQMDFVADDGTTAGWATVWTTPSFISPLNTNDGVIFTIADDWSIASGDETNISVGSQVLVHTNGDRIVPIQLLNIEPGSAYTIVRDSDTVVLYSGTVDESREFKTQRDWTTNIAVTVTVRLQGFRDFKTSATIANAGLILSVNSAKDPNYKFADGRLEQAHFRWRNDNGTESSATWLAAEDTSHNTITSTNLFNTASSGTFTLAIDNQTTAAIAYNASAATVESSIEALAGITNATVSGSGTSGDPWAITFNTPSSVNSFVVDDSGLTGGTSTTTTTSANTINKSTNVRLRFQLLETRNKPNRTLPKLQHKLVTSNTWLDLDSAT